MNSTGPTLSRADCELLARYGNARVRWARVDTVAKRQLTNLRDRVKAILSEALERDAVGLAMKSFLAPLHLHGRVSQDDWGCLYPAVVPNKAFGLQLAIIVSASGVELCCCMGAERRQARDPSSAAQNRRVLENVQQQLAFLPPDLLTTIEARLQGEWRFKRSPRQSPRVADLDSLAEWAQYAASPLGSGASISCHLSPRALDKGGEAIAQRFVAMAECFAPLFRYLYAEELPTAGATEQETEQEAGVERAPFDTGRSAIAPLTVAESSPRYGTAPNGAASNGVAGASPETALHGATTGHISVGVPSTQPSVPVTIDDAVADLFMTREQFTDMLALLRRRQNLILEGAPGVGKTFVARRLASALLGANDPARMEIVQFHQSYAYEDFVQGWRPAAGGGFVLRNGVFYEFCQTARRDPDCPYVFVIDEINRGNVSKIFGELLMLLERDKRGDPYAVPLTYTMGRSDRFSIPPNLYLIGTMNTADRSIAMVDYALRRRFAFVRLHPAFGSRELTRYLTRRRVPKPLIRQITTRMRALNEEILEDRKRLGLGFEIGHSFFIPSADDGPFDEQWYQTIVTSEIEPLLREYWFDDPDRVTEAVAQLLASP